MTSIAGVGLTTMLASRTISSMRDQLAELQRQLGTGKKSQTYGGLGLGSGLVLNMRSQLSRIDTFKTTISNVDLRVKLMNTSLQRIGELRDETRSDLYAPFDYTLVSNGQSAAQRSASSRFGEMLTLLNGDAGGRYLFSGRATDVPSVDTYTHILEGDGTRAGLKQIISERLQADQGDGYGRLTLNPAAGDVVSLEEDGTHPFGFKIAGATTSFGATITGPAGAPATLDIDLNGINPPEGATVRVQFDLPDGSSTAIELTATTTNPPGTRQFLIGATSGDTAINITAALDTEIQRVARTELAAASAIQAGNEFFATDAANPPQRVDGPPFDSATALVAGTPANTVSWYLGDDAVDSARATSTARIDDAITVEYGARANEEGIRWVLQNTAVFAAVSFTATDVDSRDRYYALAGRVGAAMDTPPGQQEIEAIQTEIAGANLAAQAAKTRLTQRAPVLQNMIDSVENVSDEEIGVKMLALNTRMQASLQVTAMLSQLSLVNYI
jgi:flagellar hook-associated protein 3 FlgL